MISKLHPLIVHLPIGFIVLAFLLETYVLIRKPRQQLDKAIDHIYLGTTLASAIAIVTGLLLAGDGKFTPSYLLVHKWLAFAVLIISGTIYVVRTRALISSQKYKYALSAILFLVVSITGHYGGTLTHGSDYLFENAPPWLSKLVGVQEKLDFQDADPDSVIVFEDLVQPILNRKCSRCHNVKYPLGGLNTTSYASVLKGGEDIEGIVPGKPLQSGILIRPGLPVEDDRFMPPDGKTLSQGEFAIIKHWIESGADSAMQFDGKTLPSYLRDILLRDFNLDYTPRPHYMKLRADSLGPEIFESYRRSSFELDPISEKSYFLDVRIMSDTLTIEQWQSLSEIAFHIITLDLSESHLVDTTLSGLQHYENLVRLDLHSTNVSDTAMLAVQKLEHLEVLNVYNTPLTIQGLEIAAGAPSVKRMYIWQTGLKEGDESQLKQRFSGVSFIGGSSLSVRIDSTSTDSAE